MENKTQKGERVLRSVNKPVSGSKHGQSKLLIPVSSVKYDIIRVKKVYTVAEMKKTPTDFLCEKDFLVPIC